MATYVIGDVQGCYDELMQLLEIISFNSVADCLWFVGDLVNRGSQSLEVLRFVANLAAKHQVVLGNHDLHLLVAAHDRKYLRKKDTFLDVLQAPDLNDLIYWLRQQKLCYVDEDLNFVMSHAGISPQWDLATAQQCANEFEELLRSAAYLDFLPFMYGDKPDLWNDNLQGWDRYRYIVNAFTRMRYCDKEGRFNLAEKGPPGTQPANLIPWFKMSNHLCKNINVVFGHWASLVGEIDEPGFYGVDTGCCWGKKLTALQLESLQLFSCGCKGVRA